MGINKSKLIIKEKLKPILAEAFGYHALLYSKKAKELVSDKLIIRHQVILGNNKEDLSVLPLEKNCILSRVQCLYEELPIASDTVDFAFMPEILQNSDNPHQVLREVERVLIPEGNLVLVVNNPIGITSLKNQMAVILFSMKEFVSSKTIRNNILSFNFHPSKNTNETVNKIAWLPLGKRRISDWFNLLGIEKIEEIAVYDSMPKLQFKKHPLSFCKNKIINLFNRTFADQIIIVAKKKVSTLTPIGLTWRKNKRLVRPRIAEPSVQNQAESFLRKIVFPN